MEKDNIIHLATNLYEESFMANSYWQLLQQIHDKIGIYHKEIDVSPCFYNLIYNALLRSMLMEISKLYDNAGISLHDLLDAINPNDIDQEITYLLSDKPIRHQTSANDYYYFKNEIEQYFKVCDSLNRKQTYPVVELYFHNYYDYLKKQLCSVKKSRDKLREQRNNLLAHNGEDYNFDFKALNDKFPILKEDVDKLLDFALNFTITLISKLTGITKPETSIDIDDWERTLELVRDGLRIIDSEYETILLEAPQSYN